MRTSAVTALLLLLGAGCAREEHRVERGSAATDRNGNPLYDITLLSVTDVGIVGNSLRFTIEASTTGRHNKPADRFWIRLIPQGNEERGGPGGSSFEGYSYFTKPWTCVRGKINDPRKTWVARLIYPNFATRLEPWFAKGPLLGALRVSIRDMADNTSGGDFDIHLPVPESDLAPELTLEEYSTSSLSSMAQGDAFYRAGIALLKNSDPKTNPKGWLEMNDEALVLFSKAEDVYVGVERRYRDKNDVPESLKKRIELSKMRQSLCEKRGAGYR